MPQRKQTVPFSPPVLGQRPQQSSDQEPFIHPSVGASPEAMAYAIGAQARLKEKKQVSPLQKYLVERPGSPPAIPPLEAQHYSGLTMEQQAGMYGPRPEEVAAKSASGESIVDSGPQFNLGSMNPSAQQQPRTPQQMGIMTVDMLPEAAAADPQFIKGQGSMYAVNQPALAMKYGVIRNGIHIPPQALQANIGQSGLRSGTRPIQETLRDLSTLAGAQAPKDLPKDEEEAEKQVAKSSASASQNVGKVSEEDKDKEIEEALRKLDDFDYDALRRQMNRDEINNPDQREVIESRLAPMDITELITRDRVTQEVVIIPGKFWILFQSMTGDDDLELKRLLMTESKSVEVSQRYLLDKFAMMTLTAGCIAINGNPCPTHLNERGEFSEEKFWLKFNWMLKRGIHVLASIGCNHTWFELRVRRLLVAEKVKNG